MLHASVSSLIEDYHVLTKKYQRRYVNIDRGGISAKQVHREQKDENNFLKFHRVLVLLQMMISFQLAV